MSKLRPTYVAVIAAVLYLAYVALMFGSPLGWVTLGERFADDGLPLYSEEGYDGQFNYAIARDLSCPAAYIDVPAYRCQRIILPLSGALLSFGQAALIPYALALVNLFGVVIGVHFMAKWLETYRANAWFALGYGLAFGVLGGVRMSVAEPLAYGLAMWGMWLVYRERLWWSIPVFALAGLSKETALLIPAGVGLYLLLQRQLGRAIGFGVGVLSPFVVWQFVLYQMVGAFGVGSGGAGATGFEIIPFMGVIRIFTAGNLSVFALLLVFLIPFVLLPTFWGLWRIIQDTRNQRWTLATTVLFTNVIIMLFVPLSTYGEINGILRFIVGLQIAVILYAAERRNTRVLLNSTLWAVTAILAIYSDVLLLG